MMNDIEEKWETIKGIAVNIFAVVSIFGTILIHQSGFVMPDPLVSMITMLLLIERVLDLWIYR